MAGYFKVAQKFNFNKMEIGERIEESDFITHDAEGNVVQLKYFEDEDKIVEYKVKPGVWKIVKNMTGLELQKTSFVQDKILENLVSTKEVEEIIDCFFDNLHLYEEFGIEIPKRNVLLHGVPGTGKTTQIAKVVNKYAQDGKTLVVVWDTSDLEAVSVKSFVSGFKYDPSIEKFILVAEDIGGLENSEYKTRSDSALLSLLDNSQKTFTIPIMIISTTNYIQNLEGNLANRSGRFDDKIEVGYPNGEARKALLRFFAKDFTTVEASTLIGSDKCKDFPPAHIKESYIRSRLRNKPLVEIIQDMIKEVEAFNKAFTKNKGMGF